MIDEYNDLISFNKIYVERFANVAVITPEEAIDYNLVGPNLRGSGVKYDVRRDVPYSVYPEFEFDVPVGAGEIGTLGDCFDRYMVRIREMKESCQDPPPVLRADARRPGDRQGAAQVQAAGGRRLHPRRERARRHGLVRGQRRHRVPVPLHVRTGSFAAMAIIDKLSRGLMIADLVAVIASLDIVAPEVDR